jgi:lipoate-protein ligase A
MRTVRNGLLHHGARLFCAAIRSETILRAFETNQQNGASTDSTDPVERTSTIEEMPCECLAIDPKPEITS